MDLQTTSSLQNDKFFPIMHLKHVLKSREDLPVLGKTYLHTDTRVHMHAYAGMHTHVHTIHTYTHTHTHTHTHTLIVATRVCQTHFTFDK